MKRSGGGFFGGSKIKKYSFENAKLLCDEVERLEAVKSEDLVEILRELVEVVVWGDKHEEEIFDLFLEKNMLENFAMVFCNEEFAPSIRVQVVQCVTILFQNLTRQSSTFFLLSGDRINRMITAEFDVNDEEIISNYVSFIKTLSLRLDSSTVQFFFNNNQLPLFSEAVGLLGHDDRMVRTSARSIVVNVLQLDEPNVQDYLVQDNGRPLFDALLGYMSGELSAIDRSFAAISDFTPKSTALPLSFAAEEMPPMSRVGSPQTGENGVNGETVEPEASAPPPDASTQSDLDAEKQSQSEEVAKDGNSKAKEEEETHGEEPEPSNPEKSDVEQGEGEETMKDEEGKEGEAATSDPPADAAAASSTAPAPVVSASVAPSMAPSVSLMPGTTMNSMSPHQGGVTTPLPSSVSQLDAAIEDLVDDFYYFNDLMGIKNKNFTKILFNRLVEFAIATFTTAPHPNQIHGGANSQGEDVLSLDFKLLMLSHWLRVNTIPKLHRLLFYFAFGVTDDTNNSSKEEEAEESNYSLASPLPSLPFDTPLVLQGLLRKGGTGASHRTYPIALNCVNTAAKGRTTTEYERSFLLDSKPITDFRGEGVLEFKASQRSQVHKPATTEGKSVIADAILTAVFSLIEQPTLLRLNTLQLALNLVSQLVIPPEVRFENILRITNTLQVRLKKRLEVSVQFFDSLIRGGPNKNPTATANQEKEEEDPSLEHDSDLVLQELRCGVPESREVLNANEVFFSVLEQHNTTLLPGLVAPSQNTAIDKVGRETSAMVPLLPPFRRVPDLVKYSGEKEDEQEEQANNNNNNNTASSTQMGMMVLDPLMTQMFRSFGCHDNERNPDGVQVKEFESRQKKYVPSATPLSTRVAQTAREQETIDFLAFLISRHVLKTKFFKKRPPPIPAASSSSSTATPSSSVTQLACVDRILDEGFIPFLTNSNASAPPSKVNADGSKEEESSRGNIRPLFKQGDVVNTSELSHLCRQTMAAVEDRLNPSVSASSQAAAASPNSKKANQSTVPDSGVRCEYAPAPEDLLPQPLVGTVLYLYFVGSQILLVQPDKAVVSKGTVTFALPLLYTEAMVHNRHQFRLTLEQSKPLKLPPTLKSTSSNSGTSGNHQQFQLKVGLAVKDRRVCQQVARKLHSMGKDLRDQAAAFAQAVVDEFPVST